MIDWATADITPLGNSKKRKFGQVFLVENAQAHQKYVLKTAKKHEVSTRALSQLRNECVFSFHHQGLPQVVFFEETEASISLVLKHKKGVGLQEYWNQLPKKERLLFTKQFVAKAIILLDEIHAKQVYHCDLKPSNFIIESVSDHDFEVHLIDFGLAVDKKDTDSFHRELIFPLGFAAPELILNRMDLINNTTDYFALGITLYRLWTGKLPLLHANPSVVTNLQLAHPIPSDSSMPKQLNEWIQHVCIKPNWRTAPNLMVREEVTEMLLQSFSKRYQNSTELLATLKDVKQKRWFW